MSCFFDYEDDYEDAIEVGLGEQLRGGDGWVSKVKDVACLQMVA